MPPRRRNPENRGLPRGWRRRYGRFWYRVPEAAREQWDGRREVCLGRTLPEALRAWAARMDEPAGTLRTVGDLLDRYERDVIPTRRPATARSALERLPMLRAVFGGLSLAALRPAHVYEYLDRRRSRRTGQRAATAALREIEVLSHAYTMAVRWGALDRHPFLGQVRRERPPPRRRYVTDDELAAAMDVAPPVIRAYVALKLLTGLRRTDLLRLRWSDVRDDGLHVETSKTGAAVVYEWTPELRDAVEAARSCRGRVLGLTVFATRDGRPYAGEDGRAPGWASLWRRFMGRAESAGVERFQERDLRAKTASDAESLERAREILAHASSATTRRHYRRRPERVRPLR